MNTTPTKKTLRGLTVAISISDNDDLAALGLTAAHLEDAMTEIARHLLALDTKLVYGGDLREKGFSQLLFELVARYCRENEGDDATPAVVNYLAWPVHMRMEATKLEKFQADLTGIAELQCLAIDGAPLALAQRLSLASYEPSEQEWADGLTAMRQTMRQASQARIVLGGRVRNYKGAMPGIAEEALLSLQVQQPLFVLGGFGGCARDIAQTMGLVPAWAGSGPDWAQRDAFLAFGSDALENGLTLAENRLLARTVHVDQAVMLVLKGLLERPMLEEYDDVRKKFPPPH